MENKEENQYDLPLEKFGVIGEEILTFDNFLGEEMKLSTELVQKLIINNSSGVFTY